MAILRAVMAKDRVQMNAEVTPEARSGWQDYADRHGVHVSNVIEAIGCRLTAGLPVDFEDPELVDEARAIMVANMQQRRRRSR